jgi:hypothetical protein
MKVFFELTAGVFIRGQVRQELNNSKEMIKHWYPECRILLTESKDWLESVFYFEADNLPDSAEKKMRSWVEKIRSLEN